MAENLFNNKLYLNLSGNKFSKYKINVSKIARILKIFPKMNCINNSKVDPE